MYVQQVENFLKSKIGEMIKSGALPQEAGEIPVIADKPKEKSHGDYSTNFALIAAKKLKRKPLEVASELISGLRPLPDYIEDARIEGAGFVNFNISRKGLFDLIDRIIDNPEDYGRCNEGNEEKFQVEFVSANPVGPLHVGHGRWAALGDSLASLLSAAGYNVSREFYLNDRGTQMEIFARSIDARSMQREDPAYPFPEDGYQGSYIIELAEILRKKFGNELGRKPLEERLSILGEAGYEYMRDQIKTTLENMGVRFDVWKSERDIYNDGWVKKAVESLKAAGVTYEEEGALWFDAERFGDRRPSVLIRSNGEPTYFTVDIAYHMEKFSRGFDHVLNLWGADHGGHVKRLHGALSALGIDPGRLEVLLGQMVNLKRGGEPVRMSKRSGEMVTFSELLEEVGKDAARFLFLTKSANSTLDFDIEAAVAKNLENPVYYVQYAHARLCSLFSMAEKEGIKIENFGGISLEPLREPGEMDLLRHMETFPFVVRESARGRAPHHLTHYLAELASYFHSFYNHYRILGTEESLRDARLKLCRALKTVISNCSSFLGVNMPEKM
ncbi:MAG: arginine--tRNA ligase [Chloroflexi bacterium]|nr:arginine--tRNA ligase [Chloroflexota bacterium]